MLFHFYFYPPLFQLFILPLFKRPLARIERLTDDSYAGRKNAMKNVGVHVKITTFA